MYESWTIYDTGEQTKTKRPWLEYCVSRVLLCELQRLMLRVTLFPEINTSSGYVAGLNVFVEYHHTRTKKTEAKVKAIAKWAGTLLNTPWTIKGTKKQTKDTPRRLQKLINDVCLQPGLLSHSMLLVMYIPGLIRFKQTEMERVETNYLLEQHRKQRRIRNAPQLTMHSRIWYRRPKKKALLLHEFEIFNGALQNTIQC